MTPWWRTAKEVGSCLALAAVLGKTIRKGRAGPCDACRAERLDRDDKRPPLLIDADGWKCMRCGERGSVLDLAAWRAFGREFDARDPEQVEVVRGLMAREGWCEGPTDVALPRRCDTPPPLEAPPKRPADRGDVERLWATCGRVTEDIKVARWLASRAVDPTTVERMDLARVLVADAWVPKWASRWMEQGVRVVLPLFDGHGQLRGLHGRALEGSPKSLRMAGVACRGLVFANAEARVVLEGGAITGDAIVAEGGPDYLTVATTQRSAAVLGLPGSGAWSAEHGARLVGCEGVTLATHMDEPGHRYAAKIEATLVHRHRRSVWREGVDLNDIHQAGGGAAVCRALYQRRVPLPRRAPARAAEQLSPDHARACTVLAFPGAA